MPLFHLILIAVIQGVTEFLPISSSGHLILLPGLTGLDDQGQALDVAVHVGTLLAVIGYFWPDVRLAITGLPRALTGRIDTEGARLALLLLIATVPVVIFGLILKLTGWSDALRSITVIGWTMLIFGIVLYWADQAGGSAHTARDWSPRDAILMGLWQAIALIPGTSRSGITMTAGLFLGLTRHASSRFSFLLSIPTILLAGVVATKDLLKAPVTPDWQALWLGAVLSFVVAYLTIHFFLRFIERISMLPFVVYRLLLGGVILMLVLM